MTESGKPTPDAEDVEFAGFWRHSAEGQLAVVECESCGAKRWPPRPICGECGSSHWRWQPVARTGTVYSWTVIGRAMSPEFARSVPYSVVLVSLDDAPNVRLLGNLLGARAEEVAVGMPVVVEFEQRNGVALPQWHAAPGNA